MITITSEKVAGFDPRWAPFRGFTVLFDNPGASLTASGGTEYVHAQIDTDPGFALYRALRDSLDQIGLSFLTNTYLFCPLPPSSYHVTAWDGVNDGNVQQVTPEYRPAWEQFLRDLPGSLHSPELFTEVAASPLLLNPDWNIRLRFERLEKWSNVSIVAKLAPADDESARSQWGVVEARAALSASFQQRFGVRPADYFVPHVTLGYFANHDLGEDAGPLMEQWDALFRDRTAGLVLNLQRAAVYGFTDMATFFRRVPSPPS